MIYIGNDIIEISRIKRISDIYHGQFLKKISENMPMEILQYQFH